MLIEVETFLNKERKKAKIYWVNFLIKTIKTLNSIFTTKRSCRIYYAMA